MPDTKNADLLYGYAEIGEYLGLSDRQVEALADKEDSDLPIFPIGRRKCALKSRLDRWLADQADKAAHADLHRLADDGGRGE